MGTQKNRIILASSSVYRKQLLEKIDISFEQYSPDINETPQPGENPKNLALRLSREKALATRHQVDGDSIIIASDQVASLENQVLGKPGSMKNAKEQLHMCSGKEVIFYTGLACLETSTGKILDSVETCTVKFRQLTEEEIVTYLEKDKPFDCAGSFKSEGLGITLFEYIHTDDPNTLIGLPLIRLIDFLKAMNAFN